MHTLTERKDESIIIASASRSVSVPVFSVPDSPLAGETGTRIIAGLVLGEVGTAMTAGSKPCKI